MCGIAGLLGRVDDDTLSALRAADVAQAHRGPDGRGCWADREAGVALAHRRLAVLDLSPAGAQPMADPARGTVLVFNGEIYNFPALRRGLEADGFTFRSRSDTEAVLHAYARWGRECVTRLRGMFAFALWDGRARTVLLARDHLGQKPLYLADVPHPAGGRTVLFASELRSLLASGLVDRTIDPAGLAGYVWNGFVPGPGTLVRGVTQLPPGTSLVLRPGQGLGQPEPFWTPPPSNPGRTTPGEVRDLMAETVKDHLAADVPLGVFLSGGLDSAAVATLAAAAAPGRVKTYTVGFDDPALDESGPAAAIATAVGTDHHSIPLTAAGFLESLPKALASLDQPTFDGLNSYVVSRAVRDAGMTVALAGTGGDELFGGYGSFREIPVAMTWGRRLARVPGGVRWAVAGVAGGQYRRRGGGVPPQTRWGKLPDVLAAAGAVVPVYQVRYGLFTPDFARRLLGGRPHPGTTHGLPFERMAGLARLTAGQPPLHAVSLLELSLFLGDRLLRDSDAAGMAASLELRLPLVDHRLVEAVAGLPEADRFHPIGRKAFLRTHVLGGLDPALFDRPKRGFEMPFGTWLRGPLKTAVEPVLRDASLAASVGLDPAAVGGLWDAFQKEAPGIYWSRVWSLFALLDWCRRHRVSG